VTLNRPHDGGGHWDLAAVTTLLCDADGTLFPSEEPAFEASSIVTREFADRFGLTGEFTAEQLRRESTGRNFRHTAGELLRRAGTEVDPIEFERWVTRERAEVTDHLARTLTPDEEVRSSLLALRLRYRVAAVSSSASERLDACFAATDLDRIIPSTLRFSAEDDLPTPQSKPDPAVYLLALERVGVEAGQALAIEDAVAGVQSAVAAGIKTVGIVQFVPPDERDDRVRELGLAGAHVVVNSWWEFTRLVTQGPGSAQARK
jgi:HAD superfamily hydrolase (TIGR01509 family)